MLVTKYTPSKTHLHLVAVRMHQFGYLYPPTRPPMKDKLGLLQAALIHPHIRQLPEPSLKLECERNERRCRSWNKSNWRRTRGLRNILCDDLILCGPARYAQMPSSSDCTTLFFIAEPKKLGESFRETVARRIAAASCEFDGCPSFKKRSPISSSTLVRCSIGSVRFFVASSRTDVGTSSDSTTSTPCHDRMG